MQKGTINLYRFLGRCSIWQINDTFLRNFYQKINFYALCKLSEETICMKRQSLFSGINKKNILKYWLLKFLLKSAKH